MTNSTQALLLNDRQEAKILPIPLIKKSVEYLRKFAGWFQPHASEGAGVAPFGNTLFLCPKSVLRLSRTLRYGMGGLLEQSLCTAVETIRSLRQPKIQPLIGGLSISKGDSHAMTHQPNTLKATTSFCPLIFITGASK